MRTVALLIALTFPLNLLAAEFEIFTFSKNTIDDSNATTFRHARIE